MRRRRHLEELDRDILDHIEEETRDNIARGMPPDEARRAALLKFGNILRVREDTREVWTWNWIDQLLRDIRYAFRSLRHTPAFTCVAVASLALGIGANTAIFSFVNAILLKQLPVPEPDRLVTFAQAYRGKQSGVILPLAALDDLARRAPAINGLFGWFAKPVSFSAGDTAEWVNAELVTGQYFRTLQVKPALGRLLNEDDVRDAAGNPVCVLSYALWQREFAADPGVVGRNVFLNGHSYRVLGVTARGFYGAELQQRFDVVVPATRLGDFMPAFGGRMNTLSWLAPMARLAPGVSRTEAQERIEMVWRQVDPRMQAGLRIQDGSQGFNTMRVSFGRPVLVLMAVVALVLLVACANLANLLLARAQARAQEFAIRLSLGASRARLIRQLLVESSLLAVAGGGAGFALSFWIAATLVAFLNSGRPPTLALHVTPDAQVLAFSILLTFATAILFGLVPSWQAAQPAVVPGLRQSPAATGPGNRLPLRKALVVFQLALSLVIVFAAGLLTQTLRTLATVDLGFQPDRVIALNVDPAAVGRSGTEISAIFDELLKRARGLPGVNGAALAVSTPNGPTAISMNVSVPGYTPKPVRGDDVVNFNFVSSRYFETLGQRLLRGRDFDARDTRNSARVAIVNEKFLRHFLNGQDPIGRKFQQGGGDVEIVGVVADTRDQGIRNGPADTVYMPERQAMTSGLTLLVRTSTPPRSVIPWLLGIVRNIDRRMPVFSVRTLDADVDAGLSSERILGYLSTLFAALATLIAGIGLYGVLAYTIARRTREIGIRIALGAQKRDLTRLFGREMAALVAAGILIGAPAALASGRALRSLLFGIGAADSLTLLISAAVLASAALLATALPLWRAAHFNPTFALRYD